MSRWTKVFLAAVLAALTLLLLTFLWQPYTFAADRGWIVLGGYPLALTIAWGVALLYVMVMEGCLALPKHSKIAGAVVCTAAFLVSWYLFGKNHGLDYPSDQQFLGLDLGILYNLYWYLFVVLFLVLLTFEVALFLTPKRRVWALVSVGMILLILSLWLAFMYYATATVWCAGTLALWWEAALWRRERGTVQRMLEEKDLFAVLALSSSFGLPMLVYGLYDTLTFAVY